MVGNLIGYFHLPTLSNDDSFSRSDLETSPTTSLIFTGVRPVAEWLSHSTVGQEVPGSNPGAAESVAQ